jgi:NADH-quinone oxidoreductase subunit C
MSQVLLDSLAQQFPDAVVETSNQAGDECAVVTRDSLVDVCRFLKENPETALEMLIDVTAIDWLGRRTPRFEVVYHLLSLTHSHRLRLKVQLEEDDPTVPTLCNVWGSANWGERETWDMYGIRFEGHPDLRRILLYEEFEGHPLRKDYQKRGYQPLMEMPSLPVDAHDPEE